MRGKRKIWSVFWKRKKMRGKCVDGKEEEEE